MELSWLMRLRIAAALAVGVFLIGVLAWPLVAPATPFGAVAVIQGHISPADVVIIGLLAVTAGFVGYFVSWPYGREIGVISAPAGLAVWAVRTGSMADLIRVNPTAIQRQAVYATLKWEGLLWLAVVLAGLCGVLFARYIAGKKLKTHRPEKTQLFTINAVINAFLVVLISVIIARVCIGLLARDVRMPDSQLGVVFAQPAVGQIAFAVSVSFGIAAFVAKKFLDIDYIWPIIATAVLAFMVMSISGKANLLEHIASRWPAAFFGRAVCTILPVQLIAFGTLGSVAGFWLAVRYNYWREYHKKQSQNPTN